MAAIKKPTLQIMSHNLSIKSPKAGSLFATMYLTFARLTCFVKEGLWDPTSPIVNLLESPNIFSDIRFSTVTKLNFYSLLPHRPMISTSFTANLM